MESQSIDAAEFRARQRESWNIGARGWREWSEYIDRGTAPVSSRLVELAGIRPGSRVLDVAAGYGEPSLTAARVAGPEGREKLLLFPNTDDCPIGWNTITDARTQGIVAKGSTLRITQRW